MKAEEGAKRIGLYGGTFDPIHLAHLLLAEEARVELSLDRVVFIPAFQPPHKDQRADSADDRTKMLELAIQSNPHFSIDYREIDSEEMRYSVDTVREIRTDFPEMQIFFLMGSDSFLSIEKWHDWEDLLSLVCLAVCRRPGEDHKLEEKIRAYNERGFCVRKFGRFPIELSSSGLREYMEKGKSTRYLIPEAVREYILEKGLYGKKVE